jgi:hypothetical protein
MGSIPTTISGSMRQLKGGVVSRFVCNPHWRAAFVEMVQHSGGVTAYQSAKLPDAQTLPFKVQPSGHTRRSTVAGLFYL